MLRGSGRNNNLCVKTGGDRVTDSLPADIERLHPVSSIKSAVEGKRYSILGLPGNFAGGNGNAVWQAHG